MQKKFQVWPWQFPGEKDRAKNEKEEEKRNETAAGSLTQEVCGLVCGSNYKVRLEAIAG